MHQECGHGQYSAAFCTIKAASRKILARFETKNFSAQGTLRATAQLDLYLYLDLRRHRCSFSLARLFFGGLLFLLRHIEPLFHFDIHQQTFCVHTQLPYLLSYHREQFLKQEVIFNAHGMAQQVLHFVSLLIVKGSRFDL